MEKEVFLRILKFAFGSHLLFVTCHLLFFFFAPICLELSIFKQGSLLFWKFDEYYTIMTVYELGRGERMMLDDVVT